MSVQIIQSKCGLVLTCLLGQIILFAAPVQAGVEDKSYNVNLNSSLGENFTACFEFNANGTLRFRGLDATYSRTNLGQDQRNWQAVTKPTSDASASTALNGKIQGDLVSARKISGNAINSNGKTFTFNGTLLSEPTCPPIPTESEGSTQNPFLN